MPQALVGSGAGLVQVPFASQLAGSLEGCDLAWCLVTWGQVAPTQPEDLGLSVAVRPLN